MDLQAHPLRHGKLGQSAPKSQTGQQPISSPPSGSPIPSRVLHLNQGPGLSLDFSGRTPWNIASQKSRSGAKAPGAARKWGFTATVGVKCACGRRQMRRAVKSQELVDL
jgi:hypothetical protein